MKIPGAAIGAIFAAFIAGLISLLGLIISKEQKTSEFRQAWIDSLRENLVDYLAQINAIRDSIAISHKSLKDKIASLGPMYQALNKANFNIQLRINPSEPGSTRLLEAMERFSALTAQEANLTAENIGPVEIEFLSASQALLKSEWRRVKSGETTFKIAKIVALSVVVGAFVAGAIIAVQVWQPLRDVVTSVPVEKVSIRKPEVGLAAGSEKLTGRKE